MPSPARPSPRWKRAQAIRSAALDEMPPAGLPPRAQRPRTGHRHRAVRVLVVAGGEAPRHDVIGEEEAVVEPERLEDQLLDRLLVGLPGDLLDDPTGDRERGVVVRDRRTERRDLLDRGHHLDVSFEGVVAVAGAVEHVAGPSGGVVEQLEDRHRAGHLLVLQGQLGQVRAHGGAEVDAALIDEAHDRRGGERLAGGAELEQRVLVDRQRMFHAGHPVEGVVLLTGVVHADGHARYAEALGGLRHPLLQRSLIGCAHGPTIARRRARPLGACR